MRTLPLITATVGLAALVAFSGCRPSRVYANKEKERKEDRYREPERYREVEPPPPPRQASRIHNSSLIISPTPGFVMKRYPDGRFYHRSRYGMLYWKGYDDRFYLDRAYLNRVHYTQSEYNQWRRYQRDSE